MARLEARTRTPSWVAMASPLSCLPLICPRISSNSALLFPFLLPGIPIGEAKVSASVMNSSSSSLSMLNVGVGARRVGVDMRTSDGVESDGRSGRAQVGEALVFGVGGGGAMRPSS